MNPGMLVEYVHYSADTLFAPTQRFGILLTTPNESGKVEVLFGSTRHWLWKGDLRVMKRR